MTNKRLLKALCLSLTAMLIFSGCKKKKEEVQEETALKVNTAKAQKKELVIKESYVGTASAQEEVTVYPSANGEVVSVDVKMGDSVTEGQQLFKLDDEAARISLKSAQAGLASAQANANQTLGGQEALKEQQERQGIASAERSADSAERAAKEAGQNIDRGERKVDEAAEDRDRAREDFDEAVDRYHTAQDYYDDLMDICDGSGEFAGVSSLTEASQRASTIISAANTTLNEVVVDPKTGEEKYAVSTYDTPGILTAREVLDLADDVAGDSEVNASDISGSGIKALENAMESARTALINQRRSVDNAKDSLQDYKRQEKNAEDSVENANASVSDAIANQSITDGQLLEDTRRSLQAGINSSAVNVEQAQYNLEQYVSKSPITGVVESVSINPHDNVGTSTAAMVISNKDSMKIDFNVTEEVRNNLSLGQKVRIKNDDKKIKGHITEIGEQLDPGTGMFKIRAVVNGDNDLLSGTSVTVKVDSYRDDGGVVVPYDSVYYSSGEPFVYVAKDGKAVKRDVKTGMFDEKNIVITKGLSGGEEVITSWSSDLRDGTDIEIVAEGKED